MNITEVLDEVQNLSPLEKRQVVETLLSENGNKNDASIEERQIALIKRLHAEGVIKNIPPRLIEPRDFKPVPIKGKPLSETIIEDRRC